MTEPPDFYSKWLETCSMSWREARAELAEIEKDFGGVSIPYESSTDYLESIVIKHDEMALSEMASIFLNTKRLGVYYYELAGIVNSITDLEQREHAALSLISMFTIAVEGQGRMPAALTMYHGFMFCRQSSIKGAVCRQRNSIGWHLPFRFTQTRDARALYGKRRVEPAFPVSMAQCGDCSPHATQS
jgi:hypothetical protein